ncbi:MAG: hypothetical protein UW41_C0005G0033 [Candidatus Collierbacteria bacterium GW2011_GWC2_44_18]|uniref:Uncharacterized protein n=2 Tax=Microgenomates group TaxID=1794810 RepID=A0A0G1J8S8_9BACT|nr:MAG: hypothetical protein UW16_C0001G0019 [Microgenomates group bacterium GW2011_GWC1_44_10]KKT49530.1 MAG: hypothetical protein UW41_C0005G0033 [Candidatus Collierbacteria bacterium GW2011_GWC2_44_18]KKT67768.1 MAG: hypothetical protein UW60_C0001G0046 [Candidatus Woesebacteria bacterium GW2011_GWA2_44_33]
MLTTADKKWVKETASEIMHEEIALLIVGHIQPTLATKDDLKNFATKDDLKNFATKDDLKNFATKDDLKNFATKDELNDFRTEMNEALNKIMNTLDHFLGEMKDMRQEHDVVSYRVYRDHSPKIEDHETRIAKIESHPRITV